MKTSSMTNPYPLQKGYIIAKERIGAIKRLAEADTQEYSYKAPRKLSNIEKHNWSKYMDKEFPQVTPA